MRGLICGTKLSACGVALSVWGTIMLVILGILFSTHSAVLLTDVPVTQEDIHDDRNPPQRVYVVYNNVGYNCFVAAAVYLVFGLFSCCQMRLNRRKNYLVMRR